MSSASFHVKEHEIQKTNSLNIHAMTTASLPNAIPATEATTNRIGKVKSKKLVNVFVVWVTLTCFTRGAL
jgi:hypothetical protein